MKKYVWFSMVAAIALVGCRKKVLRDVEDGVVVDAHCSNFVFDYDEIGLDCGGADCDSCNQADKPCTLDVNEISGFLTWGGFQSKAFINHNLDTLSGSYWRFYAYTSATEYLYVRFTGRPDVETTYIGNSDGFSQEDYEAYVYYYQDFPYDDLEASGDVYVNYYNGMYTISSCDIAFTPNGIPAPSTVQSFSFTF